MSVGTSWTVLKILIYASPAEAVAQALGWSRVWLLRLELRIIVFDLRRPSYGWFLLYLEG